jgi:hypothetical protein
VLIAASLGTAQPDFKLTQEIDKAVNRGVTYLRNAQTKDGTWHYASPSAGEVALEQNIGVTSLCAIALIESGVDIKDAAIQRAAAAVRTKAKDLTYTYAIASAILFLDRVDTSGDSATITKLAQKLIQGQYRTGGWSYYCVNQGGVPEDNSNTQFAILGLWIAMKNHQFKAERALQTAERRFRQFQQADGGWGYQFVSGQLGSTTPSMTCVGLLALAVGHATRHKGEAEFIGGSPSAPGAATPQRPRKAIPDLKKDAQVMLAYDYLGRQLARPTVSGPHEVYFLWSLERVCMVMGYRRFHGVDWYNWAARNLVDLQKENGSWAGDHVAGPCAETAWALLCLRRSNLLQMELGEAVFMQGSFEQAKPGSGKEKVQVGRKGKPREALALKQELAKTEGAERVTEILELLEKTQGTEYTQALVEVIDEVLPAFKAQVRAALQRRLQRMSAKTLRDCLEAGNPKELRLATLAALAHTGDRDLLPDIIRLLKDRDTAVILAALTTLRTLSGKDFGPDHGTWQKWWEEGGK